jgi:hypothetical protein
MRGWRGAAALFACLALFLRVLIPAGFMVAPGGAPGLPLVLCTGHGPLVVQSAPPARPDKAPDPAGKHAGDHCVFAGHGAAALAPVFAGPAPVAVRPVALRAALPEGLAPGRGLAAPPPPARGPPLPS